MPQAIDASAVSRRLKVMAKAANISDVTEISGHSCRVGAAQDMPSSGLGLPDLMAAGRWATAAMPAHYGRFVAARRGGSAKLAALQNRV
jgi:hypothetical protein